MNGIQRWMLVCGFVLAGNVYGRGTSPGPQLTGTVVDGQGRPVAGASVDCYQYQSSSAWFFNAYKEPELKQHVVTDAQGGFAVPSSAGAILVVVRKPGLAPAWKTWIPTQPGTSEPIVLTTPTIFAGKVMDEKLQPVANADVWVVSATIGSENIRANQLNELFGKPAREIFSARTGADGSFRIESFPADGHAGFAVAKVGKAQRPIGDFAGGMRDYGSGQTNVELMLGPAGSVEGRILAKENGRPVPGARIRLQSTTGGGEPREAVITGADGLFRYPDVTPGEFNVMATFPGQPLAEWVFVPEGVMANIEAGKATRSITVHASKGALLEVTVVSTNELKPIAGVEVSAGQATAFTGIDGTALLRVDDNKAWLSLNKLEWSPLQTTANTTAGQTNRVRLEMTRAPRIKGIVRDSSGAPAAGVLVSFHPGHYPGAAVYTETRTDKDGRYELILQEQVSMIFMGVMIRTNSVLARDLERNLSAVHDFSTLPETLDLVLQPGITLAGIVKDTAGAPISNAAVDFSYQMANTSVRISEQPVKTDAKGEFEIPGLPQGRDYFGFDGITAEGYGSAYGRLQASGTKTNRYEFPVFVLKRADRKLSGQVFGPDGRPFAGAHVNLNGQGQRKFLSSKTDSRGQFVFDALCEGNVQLSASGQLMPGNVFLSSGGGTGITALAGDTNVVIQLRDPNFQAGAGAQLITTGIVYDPAGKPDPFATVTVWRSANPFQNTSADARGNYVARWQASPARGRGPAIKSALVARDRSRNLAGTRDLDESVTNLDIHLQAGLTLAGSVVDSDGAPVTNANVGLSMTINRASAQLERSLTDRQGVFTFSALPTDGEYSVNVTASGYGNAIHVQAQLPEPASTRIDMAPIKLRTAKLPLAGTVVDPEDKPVSGVWVTLSGSGQPSGQVQTDANGHFAFKNVAEGSARLLSSLPGTNRTTAMTGNVAAQGGDTNVVLKLRPR